MSSKYIPKSRLSRIAPAFEWLHIYAKIKMTSLHKPTDSHKDFKEM